MRTAIASRFCGGTLDCYQFDSSFQVSRSGVLASTIIPGNSPELHAIGKETKTQASQRIGAPSMNTETRQLRIWKHSHGTDATGLTELESQSCRQRSVITIYRNTGKGQGSAFRKVMIPGDFVYLCYGNDVQLFGQVTSGLKKPRAKWVEREYLTIKLRQRQQSRFVGPRKWWAPNVRTTCVRVPENEFMLFERHILLPFFKLHISDLAQLPDELIRSEELDADLPLTGATYEEAHRRYVEHRRIETTRNHKLVKDAKKAFEQQHGMLFCEVCKFDFHAKYGKHGKGYIEAHHSIPISRLLLGTLLTVKDLKMVCANCHRMLHHRPWVTVNELRRLLKAIGSGNSG